MERHTNSIENNQHQPGQPYATTEADVTPRREGGEDAIAESSPIDTRADEKVIINKQKETLPPGENNGIGEQSLRAADANEREEWNY